MPLPYDNFGADLNCQPPPSGPGQPPPAGAHKAGAAALPGRPPSRNPLKLTLGMDSYLHFWRRVVPAEEAFKASQQVCW
ncbi:hypothetical protein AV530_018740 [Patagioenas fasciata monilis]|uniref:Uncharacterized protein n=1 Tax=Patagioenas fasciata monilis TaxID=372326 RepID=A0A1V4JJL6_PATFA|nr:hypothetical protein AV530_018740 [Patagioenas fasciata monilis]